MALLRQLHFGWFCWLLVVRCEDVGEVEAVVRAIVSLDQLLAEAFSRAAVTFTRPFTHSSIHPFMMPMKCVCEKLFFVALGFDMQVLTMACMHCAPSGVSCGR